MNGNVDALDDHANIYMNMNGTKNKPTCSQLLEQIEIKDDSLLLSRLSKSYYKEEMKVWMVSYIFVETQVTLLEHMLREKIDLSVFEVFVKRQTSLKRLFKWWKWELLTACDSITDVCSCFELLKVHRA
jgi:hypothetical protein